MTRLELFFPPVPDAARLPTPAGVLPGFSGPPSPETGFYAIGDTWAQLHLKGIDAKNDPRKATLVHFMRLCLSAGLKFEPEIKRAVADALQLSQDDPERQEYSAFGTQLHFAREYVDHIEQMKEEAATWSTTRIKPRQKLPAIRTDSRRTNALRVDSVVPPRVVDRDGERLAVRPARITVTGKSARQIITLTLSATELRAAQEAQRAYTCTLEDRRDAEGHRPARPRTRPVAGPVWSLLPDATPGGHR